MTPREIAACAVAVLVVVGVAAACDDIPPDRSKLVTDVPPPNSATAGDDAQPPAYEASVPDGGDAAPYTGAVLTACDTCVCAKDTSYCFAGATLRAPMGGAGKDAGDAGPPICTTSSGASATIGCTTLPAACAAKPTCACIIDALQPLYRCYLNCADDGSKWLVYCPS
jgi:hypothetical protein